MGTVAIVGASVGGINTARALRSEGYTGEIVVIGDETGDPYDKPPLSKAVLSGQSAPETATLMDGTAAAAAGITLELGQGAVSLDVRAHALTLADGAQVGYDALVIATGTRARPSPWGYPEGVHVLRTMDDCLRLRESFRHLSSVAIIGAGFIGAEVAATAHSMGVEEITLIDPESTPMSRVMQPEIASRFAAGYAAHGINLRLGTGVASIDRRGTDLVVGLSDGSVVTAGAVLVGIGAIPNDDWLLDSGLEVDNGVVCDQYSRCVGSSDIFAVGDVARWWSVRSGHTRRVEHWTNAVEQAGCVAHNIAHPDDLRTHDPVGYVWSDQFDWKIQIVGETGSRDYQILDSPSGPRSFAVLHADSSGRLAGAIIVNWPRALAAARRSVGAAEDVTAVAALIAELPAPTGVRAPTP